MFLKWYFSRMNFPILFCSPKLDFPSLANTSFIDDLNCFPKYFPILFWSVLQCCGQCAPLTCFILCSSRFSIIVYFTWIYVSEMIFLKNEFSHTFLFSKTGLPQPCKLFFHRWFELFSKIVSNIVLVCLGMLWAMCPPYLFYIMLQQIFYNSLLHSDLCFWNDISQEWIFPYFFVLQNWTFPALQNLFS